MNNVENFTDNKAYRAVQILNVNCKFKVEFL